MDLNDILKQAKQMKVEQARDSMFDFVTYTKPNYTMGWFNQLICKKLDQFLKDVEDGKTPILMIFAPPRSGKSELVSTRFPAFVMGKKPGWDIILSSYNQTQANKQSRFAKGVMREESYHDIFPDVHLPGSRFSDNVKKDSARDSIDEWETVHADGTPTGSKYIAAGVGGSITGSGFNIGIIDDPVKDYAEAASPTVQENNIDWYDSTFFTRRDPKIHGILIILTRWHPEDLAGKLLSKAKEAGVSYDVLSFPMVAEHDEHIELNGKNYLLRKEGEILFPERMPPEYVEKAKMQSPLIWSALYQQSPTIKGGSLFREENWKRYQVLPKMKFIKIYADTAQKAKEHNDRSSFQVWGVGVDDNIYKIDNLTGRWESPELKTKIVDLWNKYKKFNTIGGTCNNRGLMIEDKASGTGLIQTIKKEYKIPVFPLTPDKDKISRANDVIPYIAAGMVYLPEEAPWLHDYLTEFSQFNAETVGKVHDDQIDATVYAIADLLIQAKAEPNIRFL